MNDSLFMRSRETVGDLTRIVDHSALGRRSSTHSLSQRLTFQQFRDDVRRAFMRVDVVDDQNVRMIERPGRLCFLLEPSKAPFVGRKSSGQNPNSYLAIHLWIVGAIHLAHSALANLRADFVAT